jgi:hypothetical protein
MDLLRRRNARRIGLVAQKEGIPQQASAHPIVVERKLPSRFSCLPPLASVALYGPNDKVPTKVARPKARGRDLRKTVSGGWG